MPPLARRPLALAAAAIIGVAASALPALPGRSGFGAIIARLSEPGGQFDSNNLVSNEKSYLHVVPALRDAGLQGGVYLGVGPDQNFTYIAQARPALAFIVDIRRDNLLLHLLFKALFQLSPTRVEYLSQLFGRPAPKSVDAWREADIERIVSYIDDTPASPDSVASVRARADATIKGFGVALSGDDLETIARFHRVFIERGPALKFESYGRPSRGVYPTYRELLLETDMDGRRWNYLASEADFQFVRSLQARDLVVPVVGDLAGPTAVRAVGRLIKDRGLRLSAFYTSNVEYYLSSQGAFQRFVANLAELPHDQRSVIIRAVFPNRFGWLSAVPGYYSTSQLQRVDDLLDGTSSGRIRNYRDLIVSR
jgi:hypothetical protein